MTRSPKPPIEATVDRLVGYLDNLTRPILWIGAGLSIAAGYPGTRDMIDTLRDSASNDGDDIPADWPFTRVVDRFIELGGGGTLQDLLYDMFRVRREPTSVHQAIARLAERGYVASIVTTNYDQLIERALDNQGVPYVVQTLENNAVVGPDDLRMLKVHGSETDWSNIVLSGESYEIFNRKYECVRAQLDTMLQQRAVLFIGCSMTDTRILDWLRDRDGAWASRLKSWRPMMTSSGWERALSAPYAQTTASEPLSVGNIRPLIVRDDDHHLPALWTDAATRLAPLDAHHLVFTLTPGEHTWTVVGPTVESAVHRVDNPLREPTLRRALIDIRSYTQRPVRLDDSLSAQSIAAQEQLAMDIGERLALVLLSSGARAQVCERMNSLHRGRARMIIRVIDDAYTDDALALPWEYLTPTAGVFAVRENMLDIAREAVTPGAPETAITDSPLSVAVSIAAPTDQTALRHEEEAFRLVRAMDALGHQVAFTDLGRVHDFVELASSMQPRVLHFSGHGAAGALYFEGEDGRSDAVGVEELARTLRLDLACPGAAGTLPQLFYLSRVMARPVRQPRQTACERS